MTRITLTHILLVLALLCFMLSAFGVAAKINLMAIGLALWLLAMIVESK